MKLTRIRTIGFVFLFAAVLGYGGMSLPAAWAAPAEAPKRAEVIILGDRVVDIAYNLGVLPAAMSVRCAMWPLCEQINNAAQVLGCPNCVLKKQAAPVLDFARKQGINRVIIEKHPVFCKYKDVSPADAAPFLKDKGLVIEYVDFSDGLEKAVRRTAALLEGREKGDSLIKTYKKQMARTKKKLEGCSMDAEVVILNGVYQPASGRVMLRAEAPGGYADKFLLEPLGCVNKGAVFQSGDAKPSKGHYMLKKSRQGPVLKPLVAAAPDVIVMTGDAFAVQKAIADALQYTPELADVPAVKNNRIYSLPAYIDASVLEYPEILARWAQALGQ